MRASAVKGVKGTRQLHQSQPLHAALSESCSVVVYLATHLRLALTCHICCVRGAKGWQAGAMLAGAAAVQHQVEAALHQQLLMLLLCAVPCCACRAVSCCAVV